MKIFSHSLVSLVLMTNILVSCGKKSDKSPTNNNSSEDLSAQVVGEWSSICYTNVFSDSDEIDLDESLKAARLFLTFTNDGRYSLVEAFFKDSECEEISTEDDAVALIEHYETLSGYTWDSLRKEQLVSMISPTEDLGSVKISSGSGPGYYHMDFTSDDSKTTEFLTAAMEGDELTVAFACEDSDVKDGTCRAKNGYSEATRAPINNPTIVFRRDK